MMSKRTIALLLLLGLIAGVVCEAASKTTSDEKTTEEKTETERRDWRPKRLRSLWDDMLQLQSHFDDMFTNMRHMMERPFSHFHNPFHSRMLGGSGRTSTDEATAETESKLAEPRVATALLERPLEMSRETAWAPTVDIAETADGKALVVHAELPGVKRDDVNVEIANNVLTLTGVRKRSEKHESANLFWEERSHGSFSRSFRLPDTIESDGTTATFQDGVLEITIPKRPSPPTRKIAIGGGSE